MANVVVVASMEVKEQRTIQKIWNEDGDCLNDEYDGSYFSPRNRPIDEGKNEMSPKKIESLQEWSQKEVVATELVILNGYMNNPDTNEY